MSHPEATELGNQRDVTTMAEGKRKFLPKEGSTVVISKKKAVPRNTVKENPDKVAQFHHPILMKTCKQRRNVCEGDRGNYWLKCQGWGFTLGDRIFTSRIRCLQMCDHSFERNTYGSRVKNRCHLGTQSLCPRRICTYTDAPRDENFNF